MLQVRTASVLCDTPQRTWSVWSSYKTNFEFNYQNLITFFFPRKRSDNVCQSQGNEF